MIDKVKRYNELTISWLKGCEWVGQPERTASEVTRGEAKLEKVFKELSALYVELKQAGYKVVPEQTLDEM